MTCSDSTQQIPDKRENEVQLPNLVGETPKVMGRCHVVVEELNRFNAGIALADRQQKYIKMRTSPFVFYRGTNHLFWNDLLGKQGIFAIADKNTQADIHKFSSEKTLSWLQGDMHVYNMGFFQNRDGDVVFDLNDFDETVVGDYQLDLWRLAASMYLIDFDINQDDNLENDISLSDIDSAVKSMADTYLQVLIAPQNPEEKRNS